MKQIICCLLSVLCLYSQTTIGQTGRNQAAPSVVNSNPRMLQPVDPDINIFDKMPAASRSIQDGPRAASNDKRRGVQAVTSATRTVNQALACPSATALYVDSSVAASGDGSSWMAAYKELRDAFAVALQCPNIATIFVAKGTYKPTDDINRDSAFTILRGGLKVIGGYAPGGASRDANAYPTVLSGDINNQNDTSDNSYHVMVIAGLGSSADSVVVDGFTITKGNANGGSSDKLYNGSGLQRNSGGGVAVRASNGAGGKIAIRGCTFLYNNSGENGGGLFCFPAAPSVVNCVFSFNSSRFGGGMYTYQSSPTLSNCIFSFNTAIQLGGSLLNNQSSNPTITKCVFNANGATSGGGMYNLSSSSPSITNCTFSSDTASSGGGIFNNQSSNPTITNCIFNANKATSSGSGGGGVYNGSSSPTITGCTFSANHANYIGGGMLNLSSSPTITGCTFSTDTANTAGGGIFNQSSFPNVTNCIFNADTSTYGGGMYSNIASSPVITRCIFGANKAYSGGGMLNVTSSSPVITNCTFTANIASNLGGGIYNSYSSPTITNCTLNANIASSLGGGIYNYSSSPSIANCIIWSNNTGIANDSSSTPKVSYSDVQGTGVYPGAGNINADPRFVNPADPDGADNIFRTADDGLELKPNSPVINKGNNDSIPAGITTDITGAPRIQQGTVDMGAYESPYTTPVFLSINDVTQAEGNSGTTDFTFTISLSAPAPPGGLGYTVSTADSTATAPGDYASIISRVSVAPGQIFNFNFTVSVKGDNIFEPDEYFKAIITNITGTGVFASDSIGIGTILNDDTDPCATDQTPPVITPKNITVYLNASGQASIQPFDVIQSVTDNCQLDSASIRISQSQFTCADVGDSTTAPITHLAYVASTSTGNQAYGGELGMEFSVNKRITVNQLGAFDHQSNGITGAVSGGIRVAIFNKATQQIVPGLDAIVIGDADGFASNHRLRNITPVQLLPGNYVVVAKGYNANELNGNSGLGSPVVFGDNAAGAISYTGSGLYGTEGSGFSYPQNPDAGPANRYLAGTFSFSVDSTTPPATAHQAYTASTFTGVQAYGGELGMAFQVNTSAGITISRLGAFDHQGNGINGSVNGGIRVAIFNQVTQQIVPGLDAIITGQGNAYSANHRFVNITPVSLPAGNYLVVAKGYNSQELNGNSGFGTPPAGTDDASGAIAYTGGGFYGSEGPGFNYPQNTDGGPATRYLAGSFIYTVNNGNSIAAAPVTGRRNSNGVAAITNSEAASTHQAYTASTSTGVQSYGGELGMEFRVNNPSGIVINQLGAFDHQGNGITGTQNGGIRVAIFNKASRSIVAGLDATVSGQGDAYASNHRLKNISPVTLLPGDYVVVAKGYNASELNGNAGFGTPPAGTDDAGGAITYTGSGLYGNEGAGFSYPQNPDGGPATRYLAGTFVYSVAESAGSRTVTITASDKKGNTSMATAQVTVKDTLGACSSAVPATAGQQVHTAMDVEAGSAIRLYPNPARDRFTLQLGGMKGTKGTIEVLDINGRVLEQRSVDFAGKASSQTQVFSLSAQPSGIYFVRVRSEEGVKTLKVIVAR